jgi:hypothetical protein
MLFNEGEDIPLAEAVNIVAVAVVATGALEPVAEPPIRNPLLNLVVVFAPIWGT